MDTDSTRYRLPLPALQQYLGTARPDADETFDGGRLFQRGWSCGCTARYRDSPHQTATWRLCATHRTACAPQTVPPPEPAPPALGPSIDDFLERPIAPRFCIVDSALNVLYQSQDSEPAGLVALARGHIFKENPLAANVIVHIDAGSVLRIVPVSGAWTAAYALFVEPIAVRGSLADAVRKFRLTRREAEVLGLIAAHHSTSSIARELCIADSTAADHVKNVFRKLDCNKRTELFEIVFHS